MAPGFSSPPSTYTHIYTPSFVSPLSSHPSKSPLLTPVEEAAFIRRFELLHLRAVDLSLSIYSLFGKSLALFPVFVLVRFDLMIFDAICVFLVFVFWFFFFSFFCWLVGFELIESLVFATEFDGVWVW